MRTQSQEIRTFSPSVQTHSLTSKIFFSLVEDLRDMDAEMMEFSCCNRWSEANIRNDEWVFGNELLEVVPQCGLTDRLQALHRVREVAHEGESVQSLLQSRYPPQVQEELVFVSQLLHRAAFLLVVDQQLHLIVRRNEVRHHLQKVYGQGCLVVPEQGRPGQLALQQEETVEAVLALGTYVSMAVQMVDGLIPALRKVIAKFLALLLSNRDVLLGAFLDGLFSLVRSAVFPWALVLKCCSNMSMFNSWRVTKREVETRVAGVRRYCGNLLRGLLTPRTSSSSISLKTVPVTWLGLRACQFNNGILNLV